MNEVKRGLLAALVGVVLASGPVAGQGLTESRDTVPSLVVVGHGQARVAPDEATVRLGVQAQAESAGAAQGQVSRTAAAVLEAIRRLGVRLEQIRTSELSLSPVYSSAPRPSQGEAPQPPRVVGYQASNVVSITLDRMDQVGPVIDAGLGAGANRLEGVGFGLRHDDAARQAALRQAVEEARSKAAVLAAAMRLRLAGVMEVREEGVSAVPPRFEAMRMSAAAGGGAVGTPVSSGQVEVSAAVTVRYHIAPCPAQGPCDESQ